MKPLAPEDIKVGMYIVVYEERKEPKPEATSISENVIVTLIPITQMNDGDKFVASGVPGQVKGISLPFLVVDSTMPSQTFVTIDLRFYTVRQPSRSYVNVFLKQKRRLLTKPTFIGINHEHE